MFDSLIKLVLKEDYKGITQFINNYKNIDLNEYLKALHILIWMLENNIIDDHMTFMTLYIFLKYRLDILDVKNIELYVNSTVKYKLTYTLLRAYYEMNIMERKIGLLISKIKLSKGSIGKKYKNENITIKKLRNLTICDIFPLISLFNDRKFIENLILPDTYFNFINSNTNFNNHHENKKHWQLSNSDEMCNRLRILVKEFGLNFLYFMQVPIITGDDYDSMRYKDRVKYYKKCISQLTNGFTSILKYIKNYKKLITIVDNLEYHFNTHYRYCDTDGDCKSEYFIDTVISDNLSNECDDNDASDISINEAVYNVFMVNERYSFATSNQDKNNVPESIDDKDTDS